MFRLKNLFKFSVDASKHYNFQDILMLQRATAEESVIISG